MTSHLQVFILGIMLGASGVVLFSQWLAWKDR